MPARYSIFKTIIFLHLYFCLYKPAAKVSNSADISNYFEIKTCKSQKLFLSLPRNYNFTTMTRTINISLNVPESYGIEELTRQLTEYGERLISRRKRAVTSKKRHSQTFLKGLSMPSGMTDKELIDEYLSEKYGL